MRATPRADLLAHARSVRERAYAPYSAFHVGAALETSDGTIIEGCNVENASYGLTVCAERSAVVRAIAQGHREFLAIAVAGPDGSSAAPCGACRQFLIEFNPSLHVTYTTPGGIAAATLDELLPHAFSNTHLP